MTIIDQIVRSPRLPQYVRQLSELLDAERTARDHFLNEMREDQKTEFINGKVIVHSPARFEHIVASDNLFSLLRAFVSKHALGTVFHEKALISLTRNDYEPDISFFGASKAASLLPAR